MCYECRTSYQAQAPAAMRRPHTTTPKHFVIILQNCASPLQGVAGGHDSVQSGECSGARSYSNASVCLLV